MPAASLDEYGQFFPADMYNQETLEAVLRQPVTAPVPVEREPAGSGASANGGPAGAVGAPRRRPFRTDRHSKIRTAQGVRDRRMRLSVGVARDFFALQDRLGFDKASKTVDWLLTQSKPAIDGLTDASAPGAVVPVTGAAPVLKDKGEAASSSSAGCFKDARERTKGRGGDGSPTVLMEERGGGELDWIMSEATAAATEQPMDGSEYYYQYYQLEEMMRAATTEEY